MGNPAGVRRDFEALEKRRFAAIQMLERGLRQAEIARRLRVVPQTVARWVHDYRTQGKSALRKAGRAGRKPRLSEQQRQQLEKHLVAGPERLGYETPLWTCPRVAHLIEQEFNVRYHEGHVWKILVGLGWSPQRPAGRARERNEEQILNWKKKVWPELKKKARREGRILVFIDESGLSQRPHRCRTWAPRGQTPVLQYHFNWKMLSAVAGVTWWNFYFRMYAGTIKKEQVVDFLGHLLRHLAGPLLIIWDRLPAHRSYLVADFIRSLNGWIEIEYLPAYAPELNPVEYLWGHWKHHELPNLCPKDLWQLSEGARRSLQRLRRRPPLITAFWKQAFLFQ